MKPRTFPVFCPPDQVIYFFFPLGPRVGTLALQGKNGGPAPPPLSFYCNFFGTPPLLNSDPPSKFPRMPLKKLAPVGPKFFCFFYCLWGFETKNSPIWRRFLANQPLFFPFGVLGAPPRKGFTHQPLGPVLRFFPRPPVPCFGLGLFFPGSLGKPQLLPQRAPGKI